MKVREIMTSNPRTADLDTTLEAIATMMKDEEVGVIPVLDDDRVAGLVTDRDIVVRCIAAGKDATECTAEDVMSDEVKSIDPEADVNEAARLMSEVQIRRLPVVAGGRLVGMLSLGDIAVKTGEDEEEVTAETLEEVSQGVKPSRGRRGASSEEEMDEETEVEITGRGSRSKRGPVQKAGRREPGSARKAPQGVSKRAAGREDARPRKAAPKRAEAAKRGSRRRAS
ncbi:MAG TPA: CBS domain-containing protein [Terriglobales bacterium]|nr:CBS domain-containing protein [Terriglobales bacterium]